MYAIALDPGVTTGVACVPSAKRPWDIEVCQLGPELHHAELYHLLTLWEPDYIICESFENRSQDAVSLAAPEYIGVVKAYQGALDRVAGYRPGLIMQSASTGKAFWDNDKLKAYGAYCKLKHARDATRHYLYWQSFTMKNYGLIGQSLESPKFEPAKVTAI